MRNKRLTTALVPHDAAPDSVDFAFRVAEF